MLSSFNNILKSSIMYLIGNVSSKFIIFLLLPLYTKYLTPEQYGLYDLEITYLTLMLSVLFLEIWSPVLRYIYDCKDICNKYNVVKNGLFVFALSAILFVFGMIIVGGLVKIEYLVWLILYGLLYNTTTMYNFVARGLGYNKLFAVAGFINTIIVASVNVVMIVFLHMGVISLFIASIIGLIVNVLIIEKKIALRENCLVGELDFTLIRQMLKYAIPLCMNSLSFWFLTAFNRIAISNTLTLYDNGLYAVAGKFGTILSIASSAFTLAWQETAFAQNSSIEKRSIFFSVAFDKFLNFMTITFICFLPAVWYIFPIIIDGTFGNAREFVPLCILASFLSILSGFLASIFGNYKNTNDILITTTIGAIINIALIYLLIGKVGLMAANISMSAGYLITVMMRIHRLRKNINFQVQYVSILRSIILSVIAIIVFNTGGYIMNGLFFLFGVTIGVLLFKKELNLILDIVRSRLKDSNSQRKML